MHVLDRLQAFQYQSTEGRGVNNSNTNMGISKQSKTIQLVHRGTQNKNRKQDKSVFLDCPENEGQKINIIRLLGIASDEPERIARHESKKGIRLPLVEAGWTEAMCRKWCEDNDLLSPIYTDSTRGGCWFCHNQSVDQLRKLRKKYPDLWQLLLKWDSDSPVTFHADGHTVHDFDKRFRLEDLGKVLCNERWKWNYLEEPPQRQYTIFDCFNNDGTLKDEKDVL